MNIPAIRHMHDRDHFFTGRIGTWANCGERYVREPTGVVTDCPECTRLDREKRLASGSHPPFARP